MRYAIVIEKAEGNYCSYLPDLPGCVATGATEVEAVCNERAWIGYRPCRRRAPLRCVLWPWGLFRQGAVSA